MRSQAEEIYLMPYDASLAQELILSYGEFCFTISLELHLPV